MYGSDAGQPMPSLYTKGLSPLCDNSTGDKIGMAGACKLGDAVTSFHLADMSVQALYCR